MRVCVFLYYYAVQYGRNSGTTIRSRCHLSICSDRFCVWQARLTSGHSVEVSLQNMILTELTAQWPMLHPIHIFGIHFSESPLHDLLMWRERVTKKTHWFRVKFRLIDISISNCHIVGCCNSICYPYSLYPIVYCFDWVSSQHLRHCARLHTEILNNTTFHSIHVDKSIIK